MLEINFMNDFTNDEVRYSEWQMHYQEALLELDRKRLKERIATAEAAIAVRLRAIAGDSNHHTERQAIEDALSSLRVLRREID